MKTHVVVTVYTNAKGTVITHAYGPYTPSRARTERKRILDDRWWPLGEGESLRVSAVKVIDIDAMNADALPTYKAGAA